MPNMANMPNMADMSAMMTNMLGTMTAGTNGPHRDFGGIQSGWKNSGEWRNRIKIKFRYGYDDGPGPEIRSVQRIRPTPDPKNF